jgi:hypothetical protein
MVVYTKDPARLEALASGAKRYIPTRPCPRGHFEKYTSTSGCVVCSDESWKARRDAAKALKPKKEKKPTKLSVTAFKRTHDANTEAASERFNFKHPVFINSLARDSASAETRERSDYLDRLITDLSAFKKKIERLVPHDTEIT